MRFRFNREEQEPSIFDLAKSPLVPIPLFRFKFPLKGKFLLPDLTYLNESSYHTPISLSWSHDGITVEAHYSKKEFTCLPTNFKEGDALELFIDTRDNKQGNYPTKFCHHFLFYPEQVDGLFGRELTRFRGEETHDLANPKLFVVKLREKGRGAILEIFIPKEALCGYDPEQFNRMGFTYRCHLRDHEEQLFSTSPQFSIEQNPSFFASFEMK